MLSYLKALANRVVSLVTTLYHQEPARVVSVVVAAIVTIGGVFGIVLTPESVTGIVGTVLAILIGGEVIRSKVTPVG